MEDKDLIWVPKALAKEFKALESQEMSKISLNGKDNFHIVRETPVQVFTKMDVNVK